MHECKVELKIFYNFLLTRVNLLKIFLNKTYCNWKWKGREREVLNCYYYTDLSKFIFIFGVRRSFNKTVEIVAILISPPGGAKNSFRWSSYPQILGRMKSGRVQQGLSKVYFRTRQIRFVAMQQNTAHGLP
jgi:hypothetical protein